MRVPIPEKNSRPTAQLFSKPPPPPPWSKNFIPTASGPQRSITALTTRAPRSTAYSQLVRSWRCAPRIIGTWSRAFVSWSGA